MFNFVFQNTTKLVFGRGQIAQLSSLIPTDKKVLITFGGGSVKRNGVYDQVKKLWPATMLLNFGALNPIRP